MRKIEVRLIAALAIAVSGIEVAHASDRIMDVATVTFSLPPKVAPDCTAALAKVETEAQATALLTRCGIAFDRDHYSLLKSKVPTADWARALADAPIGKATLRKEGGVYTYAIVLQERVLGMASLGEAFPIRRVIYEGTLDAATQKKLAPLHNIDDVIRVLIDRDIKFTQDGGTLLSGSVPADVSGPLATMAAGEPILVQARDHGTIYARRSAPKP